MAANSLTLLVQSGIQFNGADLRGIRIPGADLSYGLFDSAQLQGADLRNSNLCSSWLRQANLSGAQMEGVQFGEWPYLTEESYVLSCAYSPDGKHCAVGLENGTISVYSTLDWQKIHTLEGHTGRVLSVVYSPSGAQIASASQDNTVRLWDVASGQSRAVIESFGRGIYSVVWKTTPDSTYLVIGSGDRLVCQWQVIEEGDEVQVRLRWLSPHSKLEVRATSIDGVEGLNELNRRLLKQLGAVGCQQRFKIDTVFQRTAI